MDNGDNGDGGYDPHNMLESEEDINPDVVDDEFNYDIERDEDDDDRGHLDKPRHISRKSISDLVNAQLEEEININMEDSGDHDMGSDEEAFQNAMGDGHTNWMETAKKWMQKEKQLKDEILDL